MINKFAKYEKLFPKEIKLKNEKLSKIFNYEENKSNEDGNQQIIIKKTNHLTFRNSQQSIIKLNKSKSGSNVLSQSKTGSANYSKYKSKNKSRNIQTSQDSFLPKILTKHESDNIPQSSKKYSFVIHPIEDKMLDEATGPETKEQTMRQYLLKKLNKQYKFFSSKPTSIEIKYSVDQAIFIRKKMENARKSYNEKILEKYKIKYQTNRENIDLF